MALLARQSHQPFPLAEAVLEALPILQAHPQVAVPALLEGLQAPLQAPAFLVSGLAVAPGLPGLQLALALLKLAALLAAMPVTEEKEGTVAVGTNPSTRRAA